ncbi:MAG: GGDEF domain-containing protein [Bacillota bacterium]
MTDRQEIAGAEAGKGYFPPVGDQVLREVAARLDSQLRRSDVIGRYGGEEFVIILPHTDMSAGAQVMERVRKAVAGRPISLPEQELRISLTVSIGLVEYPKDGHNGPALIAAADQAMYRAKARGRDQVAVD